MANNIKGIMIEIGGNTTKLTAALSNVNKDVRGTQAELKEVNKLLKLDPTNTEALAQKQELLGKAIEETKEKLDILKTAEEQVEEQFKRGEVSEEQYRALKREIEKTSLELSDLEEASKEADKAVEGLGKATELSGEKLKEAEEQAGDFKEKMDGLGEKAKAAAAAVGAGFVAAATYATKFETDCDKALNTVITQTGAADGEVEGLETTLLNIYKNNFGEDINDIALAMSQVKQQTGQADKELQDTTQTAILMRDTFDLDVTEGIRGVNSMMKQFGISAEEAYNLIAQGAQKGLNQNGDLADQMAEYSVYYADLGISAEEAFNMMANGAKNGTFQIDYLNDAVKEFGIRVKDGTAEDSFKQLGLDAEDLQKKFAAGGEGAREAFDIVNNALFSCKDEVQRNILGVAMYGTKWEDLGEDAVRSLVNTQGEISATNDALGEINKNKYNDIGNQIAELGRNLQADLVKPIGEELAPVISEVVQEVKSKVPQAREIVISTIGKVKEFVSFVSGNGPALIAIIAGIATGMLAWNVIAMIQGLISVFKVWKATTEGVTIAQKILNTVMNANHIGIVVTVIAALVAGLVTLFATNEDFRNKVIAVWQNVKETAANVFGSIADFFTVTIPSAFNNVVNFIKSNWQGLLLLIVNPFAGAFKLLYDNCEGFRNFINSILSQIKQFFQNLWNGIVSIFSGVGQWFVARFTEAYRGATGVFAAIGQWFGARWQDVRNALAAVPSWFKTQFQNAYANVKNVFAAIGQWFNSRWQDIKNAFSSVPSWFKTQFQNAWTNIKNAFSGVGSFFAGIWKTIKAKFTKIGTKIGDAIGGAFKSAMNSALATVERAVNKAIKFINGAIDTINKLPGVSVGHVKSVSLPRLARGGVLEEGQAIVAEAGPELVSMVNGKTIVTPLTKTARNTAMQTAGGANSGYHQTINISSPKALSPYEIARQTRNQTQRMVLAIQRG